MHAQKRAKTKEGFMPMSIIDPALIALLRNFHRAQKKRSSSVAAIGPVLIDSLRRSEMTVVASTAAQPR
jgi:hypothetical protein